MATSFGWVSAPWMVIVGVTFEFPVSTASSGNRIGGELYSASDSGRRTFGRVEVLGPDVLELVARLPCSGSFFLWACIWVEGVDRCTLSLVV